MKKLITIVSLAFAIGLMSVQAQTTCSDDRVAYVNSKNIGGTGAYNLSLNAEEKAAQAYLYSGPGKVGGARIYGSVPSFLGVYLKVSLFAVDANFRPTGSALAVAPNKAVFAWSPSFFDVNFSPAVAVNSNFAIVVEVVNVPNWGSTFSLNYTGNGEGKGEDLASLAGTSTGNNWASAMSTFSKDGDFYIYPRMIHFNTPMFTIPSSCIATGTDVNFTNTSQITKSSMFNKISASGYSGSNFIYTWNFGDGSLVSHAETPSHTYTNAGVYTVVLTTTIEGWDGVCTKTYSKNISVGLNVSTNSITNVSCFGGNNGSATANGTGGNSPYQYSMDGINYQTNATFNNLIAKSYSVYVKDAMGCISQSNFVIAEPAAIEFTTASSTSSSCSKSDGAILVATSGGVAPMQYQLNSGAFQTSGSFAALAANSYNITAKDANGCISKTIIVVKDLSGPSFSGVSSTNVSCYGGNDGSITLSSSGGTGSILYSIDNGVNFKSSGIFTNLIADTYIAIAKDASGCSDIKVVKIIQPQQLKITAVSEPLSCNGISNGKIRITSVSGGTGSVSYSLNGVNFQSGNTFSNLSSGIYTVYAKDVTACQTSISVSVSEPNPLNASVNATNALCNGNQDGTLTILGNNGVPGYLYAIGDDKYFQSNGQFNNLGAGTYVLTVKDANGCTFKTNGIIGQPTAINTTVTPTNSTCGNSNGGFLAMASGGSGSGYTFSLNNGAFGIGSFSNLLAGTYVITTKDAAGCVVATNGKIFDLDGPVIGTISHTNVNCNGGNDGSITIGTVTGGTGILKYSINGLTYNTSPVFTKLTAGQYNVTVKDAVGCIGNTFVNIIEPNQIIVTSTVVDNICNGSSNGSATILVGGGSGTLAYSINGGSSYQSSKVFSNLASGNYVISVKDAGGCLGYGEFLIDQPQPIVATFGVLDVTCKNANNGSIVVASQGGTGSHQYRRDASAYQVSNVFSNLSGGTYSISIKDANGCVAIQQAIVKEPTALVLEGNVSNVTCSGGNNGAISLNVTNGTPGYFYKWSNNNETKDLFNLAAGTYSVKITDKNGCTIANAYTVKQPASPLIVNGTASNSTPTKKGSIDITITGGAGGYTFVWSNGAKTEDVADLIPGLYSVAVTDANGCATSSSFIVGGTVGISNLDNISNELSLYPNPAINHAFVEINGYQIEKFELSNSIGQLIYQSLPMSSKYEINTSELSDGVYFVKVYINENWITKRLKVTK